MGFAMNAYADGLTTSPGRWAVRVLLAVLVGVPTLWPVASALAEPSWAAMGDELPRLMPLMGRTAAITAAVVLLASFAAAVVAGSLLAVGGTWRSGVCGLLALAAVLPLVLHVGAWQSVAGPYGLVRWWPTAVGARAAAVVLLHTVHVLPWCVGIVAAGLVRVDGSLVEQLRLHRSPWRAAWLTQTRLNRGGLAVAAVLAAVPVLTDMTVSDLYKVRTFPEEVFTEYETGAGAPRLVILVTILLATAAAVALTPLLRRWEEAGAARPARPARPASRRRHRGVVAGVAVLYLLPVLGLAWQVGQTVSADGGTHWSTATAGVYLTQVLRWGTGTLAVNAAVAATGATLLTLCGVAVAWHYRNAGAVERFVVLAGLLLSLLLPGPVIGLTLVEILNRPGAGGWLYDRPTAVVLGHLVRLLPYATLPLLTATLRLDRGLLEAAATLGQDPRRTVLRVVVPVLRPTLAVAWLLTAALALCELPTTKIVAPPGYDPLSVRVFGLLHTGTGNEQAALCLLLLAVAAVPVTLAVWLWGRKTSRSSSHGG